MRGRSVKPHLSAYGYSPGASLRKSYDMNIWTARKLEEKLNYLPNHPVKRGLVKGRKRYLVPFILTDSGFFHALSPWMRQVRV